MSKKQSKRRNNKAKLQQKEEDYNDIFEESPIDIPIIKRRVTEQQQQDQATNEALRQQEQANCIRCPIDPINLEHILQEVLYESAKETQFAKTLKSILSQGQRELKEKQKYYQFKWQSLGHLNCSRQEYQQHEQLLKEQQVKDISDIQQSVIASLGAKGIQGFQQKDDILNDFRVNFMKKRHLNHQDGPTLEEFQFYVDPEEASRLQKDQTILLEKLMEESQLINEMPSQVELRRYHSAQENGQYVPRFMQRSQSMLQESSDQMKLQLCGKLQMDKLIKDKLSSVSGGAVGELLKLDGSEVHLIPKNIRVMMLDSKSDELYTDKEFLQYQADKYVDIFNHIKNHNYNELDLQTLLELTIYIVNNTHYQQKFQMQDDRKHVSARDLLSYLEKIQKQ